MWPCFVPLLFAATLGLLKLAFFRSEKPYFTFTISLCCFCIALTFESHFDATAYNAPLWITALPFAAILMLSTLKHLMDVYYEKDPAKRIFYCYDSCMIRFMAILNMFSTFFFFFAVVGVLYALE